MSVDRSVPPSEHATAIGRWLVRILGVALAGAAYLDGVRWWTALFIWMATTFTLGVLWHLLVVIPLQETEEERRR
jgi:hypothetical protein